MTWNQQQSPLAVLWRTFFDQLFINESVTSDVHLRQAMIGVFAFLLPPGLVLIVELIGTYTLIAQVYPQLVDPFLVRLGFVFVTYSMVSVGFVAVFVWDALSFDRRDAMVLVPLPVPTGTIMLAKLGALAALLLGSALAINLFTAVPFAFLTADRMGVVTLIRHFVAHLVATMSAAIFVFGALVAIKGVAAITAGDRFAARIGALLQFACVAAVLCFALAIPHVLRSQSFTGSLAAAPWFPNGWFLGIFEVLRASSQPEISLLAARGVVAVVVAAGTAIVVSMLTVRHQLRAALAPSAFPSPMGSARASRLLARVMVAGNREARAITDFILITIARNRAQQAPIATAAAIGFAIAMAGLSRASQDFSTLTHPRTVVMWTPLVIGFWIAIGTRQSFFVPSELPAGWTFLANGIASRVTTWKAVRASMMAVVAIPALAVACTLSALIEWRLALIHAWISVAVLGVLVELLALTVRHIPFTRPYPPGHARLKTRWPLYVLGMFAVAYYPVQLELQRLQHGRSLLVIGVCITVTVTLLDVIGRHAARRLTELPEDPEADLSSTTVLDISGALQRHAGR
jgi:hypothetical protein